ncbi:MAG: RsmB/NOP family class I SAM-dependent RNA methyltransferase [archaeon]|jgi:NOL1/NOP2/sun family putative RNA methylase
MSEVYLPKEFMDKYKSILGEEESEKFFESCKTRLTKSLIMNTLKGEDTSFFREQGIEIEQTKFLEKAYFIKSEVSGLGNTIEQNIGLFQMQEISSMLPAFVLNPRETDVILDLTAAPGNKTGILAQIMNNKGLIIANDVDKDRLKTLKFTLKRLGVTNTVITCQDGCKFDLGLRFDKILLDAPCSCEGMVRKKADSLKGWSTRDVSGKAELQKKLIEKSFSLLKIGGTLVYSTCTLSPEENEEVVDYLLKKNTNAKIEEISIPGLVHDKGIIEFNKKKLNPEIKKAIRIWPHKSDIEGFFICKIKKE